MASNPIPEYSGYVNDSVLASLLRQGGEAEVMSYHEQWDNSSVTWPWNITRRSLGSVLPLLSKLPHMVALYTLAYLVVFILGVVNNSLVVSVIIRNPAMRNVTNYFLGNLALADILVSVIVLPFTLMSQIFTGK